MLVLSRNQDSAINIGPDIQVKVLSIKHQAVKLGIEAPESVRIWRDELALRLHEQQRARGNHFAAGMKIVLVVEDDPGHAKLIRKALCQHQGTMVTVAGTAQNALHALGGGVNSPAEVVQPDLIVLDLGLPDHSGLDVLQRIRSVPELRSTPVVVLSCSDDEAVMNKCMESGANAFVSKAAGYDDLHSQVRRLGQFWAGDCFARRKIGQHIDEAPTDRSAAAAAKIMDEAEEQSAPPNHRKRILVADDDAGHVTLIKRALRRGNINCAVDVVRNGVEAIDYLFGRGDFSERRTEAMPHLMLLDLNMPRMNGRQVLQVLRNAHSKKRVKLPPVVVLTSSDESEDVNDSYSLGAQSFIRKPIDQGRFALAIQQTTQYWLGLNEPHSHQPLSRMNVPR